MPRYLIVKTIIASIVAAGSLYSGSANSNVSADVQLTNIITSQRLHGNPFSLRLLPSINSPVAQLGKDLFFSKSLGGDRDSACVTCHHPMLGGGDNLSLSVGVGALLPDLLGVGRQHSAAAVHFDGGPPVPRNAPTTFNIAGWDSVLFHDGRLESLGKTRNANGADGWGIRTPDSTFGVADPRSGFNLAHAQARFPVTSKEEMKGFNHDNKNNQQIRDFLAERLKTLPNAASWLQKFRAAYKPNGTAQELITDQNIAFAIGQYERSQVFVNNPWQAYVRGNTRAISDAAKQGALLFFKPVSQGGAGCASCHSGDFFTDEKFYNIGMPQIGRGKGDGDGSEDFGRFRETKAPWDKYAFRTPSLLNVAVTGPWSHAGAYTSLEAVVKHHLNPQRALDTYDFFQLRNQVGIQHLGTMKANTQQAISSPNLAVRNLSFSDREVGYLVDFLHTLTDPCVTSRSCMAPWIANSPDDVDQVKATDQHGNRL